MRTPIQLLNHRSVLSQIVGPAALMFSDESVNKWADNIQERIDSIPCYWTIRVRTFENEEKDWTEISREERYPYGSVQLLKKSCQDLLTKYEKIQVIMICPIDFETNIESMSDLYIIGREL